MSYCNVCREYKSEGRRHQCPPKWEIWDANDETREDARISYGSDAESAATRWAARIDSGGDYTIVRGSAVVVCVSKEGSAEVQVLIVTGESVPEYHSTAVKDEDVVKVREWNDSFPIGTTVRFSYLSYDEGMRPVTLTGEGKTSTKAQFCSEKGSIVRVDQKPYEIRLRDVRPVKKEP